jgi:hypothetical protein
VHYLVVMATGTPGIVQPWFNFNKGIWRKTDKI